VSYGDEPRASDVAAFLSQLVRPHADVGTEDTWQPRGLLAGEEARLGETISFLTDEQREAVTSWWLAVRERANTPNWDIVSTCRLEGRRGLVIVEAKAHSCEFHRSGKPDGNTENGRSISAAIADANRALGGAEAGWGLCTGTAYQLCNRFAWAWKIASLGVPVALVYLGFLHANELSYVIGRYVDAAPAGERALADRLRHGQLKPTARVTTRVRPAALVQLDA